MVHIESSANSTSFVLNDMEFALGGLDETDLLADVDMMMLVSKELTVTTTGSDDTKKAKTTCRRRIHRQQLKNKREELKRQVIQLSEQFVRLEEVKANEKIEFHATRTPRFYHWKETALLERQQRFYAEAERSQLVTAVRSQTAYIDALQEVLRKRHGATQFSKVNSHKRRCLQSGEAGLLDAFIHELEMNYMKTDEVFRSSGLEDLNETEAAVHSVHMRESDGEVEYFQQLTKHVQPSSLEETGRSLWELGKELHADKPEFQRTYDVKDPGSTIADAFIDVKTLKTGATVPLFTRFIARRFNSKECIVHTWKFITEGEGIFNGIQVDESGWCKLLPSMDESKPGTAIQMCIRRSPMHSRSSLLCQSVVDEFYGVFQESRDDTMTEVMESLENFLLDDALTGLP